MSAFLASLRRHRLHHHQLVDVGALTRRIRLDEGIDLLHSFGQLVRRLAGRDGADHRWIGLDVGSDRRDEEQRRVVLGKDRADVHFHLVSETLGRAVLGNRIEDRVDTGVAQADVADLAAHLLLDLLEVDGCRIKHENAISAILLRLRHDGFPQHPHTEDGILACRFGVVRHGEE